jgi:hypothetical protein
MCHSLENLEYHHFKYQMFRGPGDLHAHFLGTATLSFSDNIEVKDNDVFRIEAPQFGKPLLNSFQIEKSEKKYINDSLLG